MKRHTSTGDRREPVTAPVGAAPRSAVRWRRWAGLVTVAAGIAVAVAVATTLLVPANGERALLRQTIAELAARSSPDAAVLMREAGDVGDRLLKQFPDNGEALDVVASLYRGLGKTKQATRCWQRSMELDPSLGPIARAAIGGAAYEEGQFDLAAEHFRAAMQQDPTSSVYPLHLAEALIGQGQLQAAVELLEKDQQTHPRSMPARVLIGQTYLKLRQYEKARQHLELAVRLGPEFKNSYYGLATACARLGDQANAREYMQKFKELQARDEEQYRRVLKAAGNIGEIREVAARTYTAASKLYLGQGDYQTAEDYLRRAATLVPSLTEHQLLLAWLYEQQGRTGETLSTLAALTRKDDLAAQMSIAAAYGRLGQFEQAERAYQKVIELSPGRGSGYAALADFYLRVARQPASAEAAAQKAVELEPVAEHYLLLGLSRDATGNAKGAAAAVDQALALDPDNQACQALSRRLRNQLQRSP